MPGKVLLSWFYPKNESLFTSADARDIVFGLISLHNENWLPGSIHRRVKKWEDGEWAKSIMAFIMDQSFKEYVDWDFEMIGCPKSLPLPSWSGCLLSKRSKCWRIPVRQSGLSGAKRTRPVGMAIS